MERFSVECLRCGHHRTLATRPRRYEGAGECPRCAYVGWADSCDLPPRYHTVYRSRPPQRRLLQVG